MPQFDDELAPGQSLWPIDSQGKIKLRPAKEPTGVRRPNVKVLPKSRDSTQYMTQSHPGEQTGHELYQDVSIPGSRVQNSPQSEWMFAVYNSGLQVWDIGDDPELPRLHHGADGWRFPYGPEEWEVFPDFSEEDTYVYALDTVQDGNIIYIGVSALTGVGFSIWAFDTTSILTTSLKQVYQDLNVWSYDTSLVEDPNGRVYAYVADLGGSAGNDGGIRVYDVTRAAEYGDTDTVCVDPAGSNPCGVFQGEVGDIPRAQYVSALVVNGETHIAASDGFQKNAILKLELWQVTDPANPGAAGLRFDGLGTMVSAPQLFTYDGRQYMALVENLGLNEVNRNEMMRVYDVTHCMGGSPCGSLGTPKAAENIANLPARFHFLDVSFSNGTPFLHYGLEGSGTSGSDFERLWDLGRLPSATAANALPEITDGGASYVDPCNGKSINYFGDYFEGNEYGLAHFTPRHAVFTGPYLYRAGVSVLDIHVRGGAQQTNDPTVVPRLQSAGSIDANTYWLDEKVMLEADVYNCLVGSTSWCWSVDSDNADLEHYPVPANLDGCDATFGDEHGMTFECTANPVRCTDTSMAVASWNTSSSCLATQLNPSVVAFNLKDPLVEVASIDPDGGSFPLCSTVPLAASVQGRGPVQWLWKVNGEPITGCSGIAPDGVDLSSESFACAWDSSGLQFENIFADDFEMGCGRWSSGCPADAMFAGPGATKQQTVARKGALQIKVGGNVNAELELRNAGGVVVDYSRATVGFYDGGDPEFDGPLVAPVVTGSGAVLRAPAIAATSWIWEIEDPVAGKKACTFDSTRACVIAETTVDQVEYLWTIGSATYRYKVTLSNCASSVTRSALGSVDVYTATIPEITRFEVSFSMLQGVGDGTCYKDARGGCGTNVPGAVYCPTGEPIAFDVLVAEAGDFSFYADWLRAASNELPTYAAETPTSVNGTAYVFTHTFPSIPPSPDFPILDVLFGDARALDHQLIFGTCDP